MTVPTFLGQNSGMKYLTKIHECEMGPRCLSN
jgi:hypothetical protein